MKNYELLELIGEAGDKYVLAADGAVIRPRFRWKTLAACAACVALVAVAAAPQLLADRPPAQKEATAGSLPAEAPGTDGTGAEDGLVQGPGLHDYTLLEGGRLAPTAEGALKAPDSVAGNAAGDSGLLITGGTPAPDPDIPMAVPPAPGGGYDDAPVISQDEACAQYDRLLQWMGGVDGREPAVYPDWFAGMWLDNDWPDNTARLTVAIVDSFRTEALEAEIRARAFGGVDVLFCGAKYSQNELNGLMDGIAQVFEELDVQISSVYGVYVMDNCLGLDFYGAVPGDGVLAALAELDPAGDAIRVRVFADGSLQPTEDLVKDPAPEEPAADPAEPEPTPVSTPEPNAAAPTGDAAPGGTQAICNLPLAGEEDLPGKLPGIEKKEGAQPAHYDLLPLDE